MKYSFKIDQINSIEWGFNPSEALLFAYLFELPSWAEYWISNGKIFYHASRNKVVLDAPLVSDKPDTIYRLFISLEKKGVLEYEKNGRKDGICFTEKGKLWNSEKNPTLMENSENFPTELGKKSEKTRKKIRNNSENFPTNNLISNNSINTISLKDNSENEFSAPLIEENEELEMEVHHVPDYQNDEVEETEQEIYHSKITQKEKRKSCAKKKKENPNAAPVDEMYQIFTEAFKRVSGGETPVAQRKDFIALASIHKALLERAKEKDKDFIPKTPTELWKVFLEKTEILVKSPKEAWLHDNFTPSILWSQFNTILVKIKNPAGQKPIIPLYREEGYSKSNVLF